VILAAGACSGLSALFLFSLYLSWCVLSFFDVLLGVRTGAAPHSQAPVRMLITHLRKRAGRSDREQLLPCSACWSVFVPLLAAFPLQIADNAMGFTGEFRHTQQLTGREGLSLLKMNKKSGTSKDAADKLVKGIRRKTRKQYSAEEKIRIVLAGLRGEESIAALCRREGISESLYYTWSKEFLEAGKQRLAGDTARQATSPEVKELRSEATALKEVVADLTLENRLLKKSMIGDGEYEA
jgi:transposase